MTSVQEKHGPCHKLSDQEEVIVLQSFLDKPGIYLREVQRELFNVTSTWISCATLCRAAKCFGLSRQKMRNITIMRLDILRAQYLADMSSTPTCLFLSMRQDINDGMQSAHTGMDYEE